jgi:RNA recognition motif-containing protein
MEKRLYVGGISFQATEDELKEFFSAVGEVESVKIITDSHTGQAKGFGFVEMESEEDAKKAIEALNGTTFMNRAIAVNEARPQRQRERRNFGFNRGGFGHGRDGFGNRGAKSGRGRRRR